MQLVGNGTRGQTLMRRQNTFIGSPVERVEDLRFLRGRGQYVDDLHLQGLLHAPVRWEPGGPAARSAPLSSPAGGGGGGGGGWGGGGGGGGGFFPQKTLIVRFRP